MAKYVEAKYHSVPFWSWNDKLDAEGLKKQIAWMKEKGVGGFFMHARGGLFTEYLSNEWFNCIKACQEYGNDIGMEPYAYDENGWPSGFAGGKLLEDIENHDCEIVYKKGKYDSKATVSYLIEDNRLIRTKKGDNCLNVYVKPSPSTADILNPQVVDEFINLTHEKYKKNDPDHLLKGFFTDEPQYYRWGTAYTKVLPEYFKKHYKEDIFDRLGLLFVECDGYRDFRYKYWKAMNDLMVNNFAKKVYNWCDKNGYKLTGHYVEESHLGEQMNCCAGIMPLYEYEHIPGIDHLGRNIGTELSPRQVASVSYQLDKPQVLAETFACAGWDVTPLELKHNAEHLFVNGVNLLCQHLLPFSEHGQRKRDYPAHFSAINPWINDGFKDFNDYFAVLGQMLATSKEDVRVAVLHPIRSVYFDFKRDAVNETTKDINDPLIDLITKLSNNHISFHFLDETLLAKYGNVSGKKITCGNGIYDYLIIPKIKTMDKTTEALVKKYCAHKGNIYLYDGIPEYLEGEKYDYSYLSSNISFEDICKAKGFSDEYNEGIRLTSRIDDKGKQFFYIVNISDKPNTMNLKVKGYRNFSSYDILNDSYKIISSKLTFDKYESLILYPTNEPLEKSIKTKQLKLKNTFNVVGDVENYLTLDYLKYSLDGKHYSPKLYTIGVLNELLNKRYKGFLYLKYDFDVKDIPSKLSVILENINVVEVLINGKETTKKQVSKLDNNMDEYEISEFVKEGNNEIIIVMNYYQDKIVYDTLFGNCTESLMNCLAYNSNIEAIYLHGNFGVSGSFKKGVNNEVVLGHNFKLVKQNVTIKDLIRDGYPFFRGNITLSQKVNVKNTNMHLFLEKRFHIVRVKVNGNDAGKMMFNRYLDLSKYLVKGDNDIELTISIPNRNFFGPFHTLEQYDTFVGPFTFERNNQWHNGKCKNMRSDYAFVKNII